MYRLLHIWILVGFLVLNFSTSVLGQVVFNTPTNSQLFTGQTLNVPVRVKNFNNVISAQFVIAWDSTVLEFVNVFDLKLPDLFAQGNNFGYDETNKGILRFSWYKDQTGGTTIPDLGYIFYLKFKVIGANGSGSFVSITELPPLTLFEVTREGAPNQYFDAAPQENGFQAVGYTVSTDEPKDEKGPLFDLFPNPFSEKIHIQPRSIDFFGNCRLEVRDAAGRLVFEKDEPDLQPSAGTDIDKSQFEKTGIYFLTVRTERGVFAEKIAFLEL